MPRVAGLHVVREYLENVLPHFDTDRCGTCLAVANLAIANPPTLPPK